MSLWEYIKKYFTALSGDLLALLSGIASVSLAIVAAFLLPVADITTTRNLLWLAAAICFIVASFRVWVKEYKNTIILENKINSTLVPNFRIGVNSIQSGDVTVKGNDFTALICQITIINIGTPSRVLDWQAYAIIAGNDPILGSFYHINEQIVFSNQHTDIVMSSTNLIYTKEEPIATGNLLTGVLPIFIDAKYGLNSIDSIIQIFVRDTQGKQYSTSVNYSPSGGDTEMPSYIPGLDIKEVPHKQEGKSKPNRKKKT